MKFKKSMIILVLAIFFISIAGVCASDVNDTTVASEDTQLTDEFIQASENQENEIQGSENNEVTLSEDDSSDDSGKIAISNDKTLGKTVTEHTFRDIEEAIESNCTIYLESDTYTGGICISIYQVENVKIIGNSTILDAQGSDKIFDISQSSNITIENITFKNGNTDNFGGAISVFEYCHNCSISNCTFIDNHAMWGGAICWDIDSDYGRVSNCTFINNHADSEGGAIECFSSIGFRVNDCIFINNTDPDGYAISASLCDLNADYNWFGNNATNYDDQLPINYAVHCDYRLFLSATANPDANTSSETSNIIFKLYQYHSGETSDYDNAPFKNIDLTITATNGNVSGTAKLGEPIQFTPIGNGTASVTAAVENVRQTVIINVGQTVIINVKGDFELLQDLVNNESLSVINLERNYTYNDFDTIREGVRITRPITINGNGYAIDAKGKSRIFNIESDNVVIENLTLKNANYSGDGGAVRFTGSGTVINCNFTDNTASGRGGAIYFNEYGNVTKCNFADNKASGGGAIWFVSVADVTSSNFDNNTASDNGGALQFSFNYEPYSTTVINSKFVNNKAGNRGGAVYWYNGYEGRVNDCIFINNTDPDGNAIYGDERSLDLNADYNWFGNNATNYDDQPPVSGAVYCNYRLFLSATANPDTITSSETSNIIFKLRLYDSRHISDYDNAPFKNIDLTITATNGNVSGTAKLGEPIQFTPIGNGTASVTAAVENVRQTVVINVSQTVVINVKGDFELLQDLVNNESLSVINLERNYTYNDFDTIREGVRITRPITINGNGYAIDAKGKSRIFNIESDNVVIENLTLKNANYSGDGGAVRFTGSSTVINCNFTDNTASGNGGAIYFNEYGNVTKCNFADNKASGGGAIWFVSVADVTSCNFDNNTASDDGGALQFSFNYEPYCSAVTNSNFVNNKAGNRGGAVYWYDSYECRVNDCIFINNADPDGNAIYADERSLYLNTDYNWFGNNATNYDDQPPVYGAVYCNYRLFLSATANPDAITSSETSNIIFKLRMYDSRHISDYDNAAFKNIDLTITATEGTVSGAAKLDESIRFTPTGSGTATVTAAVENVRQTVEINILKGDFELLQDLVNNESLSVINLERNYTYNDFDTIREGVRINRPITINGNGYAIDAKGKSRIFNIESDNVVIENLTLKNAKINDDGGAVCYSGNVYYGTVEKCNFVNNTAFNGGAIYFGYSDNPSTVTNCNFTNNTAYGSSGGAIWMSSGSVENCNFTGNNATTGSAIYFYSIMHTNTVSNSRFLNNRANAEDLQVTKNENKITITFTGKNNLLNAIYSRNDGEVTFTNVFYWGANGIANTGSSPTILPRSNKEAGQNMSVIMVVNDIVVLNETKVTDENGIIVLDLLAGNCTVTARHDADSYYTEAERTETFNIPGNETSLELSSSEFTVTATITPDDVVGNITFTVENESGIVKTLETPLSDGSAELDLSELVEGEYNVTATYAGSIKYSPAKANMAYQKVNIDVSIDVSADAVTYGDAVAVNILASVDGEYNVTVGDRFEVATVENGAASVEFGGLGAGTYDVVVSYPGDYAHNAASANATVKVNKATPEIGISVKSKINYGEDLIVKVTSDDNLAYRVNVTVGNQSQLLRLKDGKRSVKFTDLLAGSYTVTALYKGDANYSSISVDASVTVKPAANLTVSASAGGNGVLVVNVTGDDDLAYRVNVTVGNQSKLLRLKDGAGTLKFSGLEDGTYDVVALYKGDADYAPESVNTSVEIKRITHNLTVSASAGSNGAVVVNVTCDGDLAYRVNVTVGNQSKLLRLKDGAGTLKFDGLEDGNYSVVALYKGDADYAAESANASVEVKTMTPDLAVSATADSNGNVVVNVTSDSNLANRVNVTVGNQSKLLRLKDGAGTLKFSGLEAGTYDVVALYKGDANYSSASAITSIEV